MNISPKCRTKKFGMIKHHFGKFVHIFELGRGRYSCDHVTKEKNIATN